jgi:UDP-glucose 4-epimerase
MLKEFAAAKEADGESFSFAALRYFNAAGADAGGKIGEAHDPESHLIPVLLDAALSGRKMSVFGDAYPTPDGTCVRAYIHVDDIASAHLLAYEAMRARSLREVYNLGNGSGFSVLEVLRTAEEVTGKSIARQVAPPRPGDPPCLVGDASKIEKDLNWKREYPDLESIVQTAWKWHRTHPNGYARYGKA